VTSRYFPDFERELPHYLSQPSSQTMRRPTAAGGMDRTCARQQWAGWLDRDRSAGFGCSTGGSSLQGDIDKDLGFTVPGTAQVIIRPPLAWGLAVIAGLALNWLVPLPFLPADLPAGWLGAMVFVLALALVAWAIITITRAGSNVPTNLPTTTIVESGPYRFTRNPIYLGMFLGLIGLAIAFDNLWLLMMLAPFALVIRYGVVAREEAYLERKFGDVYRGYRSRVRRWL